MDGFYDIHGSISAALNLYSVFIVATVKTTIGKEYRILMLAIQVALPLYLKSQLFSFWYDLQVSILFRPVFLASPYPTPVIFYLGYFVSFLTKEGRVCAVGNT